jgi:hypothetical protein
MARWQLKGPVGLSVEMAEQIRTDLRDMARARRIARLAQRVDRVQGQSVGRVAGTSLWAYHRRWNERAVLRARLLNMLVDVCHG